MVDVDLTDLPAHHSSEEILSHLRFPFARGEFIKAILALYEHNPFLNRLLLEAGRAVLVNVIMCLHARYDEADRATWPTLRLVTESTAAHGVASPRRIHDLVARLIETGYLEQRAVPRDRRVRILTPTQKMIAQDQDFLVSHYLPLAILFPQPGYSPIIERDPVFQLKQRLVSTSLFALSAHILARNPIIMLFMSRDVGIMILIKLMHTVGAQADAPPPVPQQISFSDFGTRFGASRTHVRKILKAAEEQNLVRLTKDGGQFVEVMPELVQAFDRFIADAMAGHDLCYNLALQSAN